LGTHVFTLLELQNEAASFRWNVVSMTKTFSDNTTSSNKKLNATIQGIGGTAQANPRPDDANAALDRIEMPQDAAARSPKHGGVGGDRAASLLRPDIK
jgi:hypothetical protein